MDLLPLHGQKLASPSLVPLRSQAFRSRWIKGLRAAEVTVCPHPKTRARAGSKAQGLAFERLTAKALGGQHNPWYRYEDSTGRRNCSPDILLDLGEFIVVVEVKLTDISGAWDKLLGLYKPIVELVHQKETIPVVVVKNLTPNSKNVVTTLKEAVLQWKQQPTLHWLGKGQFPLE